jgi:hypothetical protein
VLGTRPDSGIDLRTIPARELAQKLADTVKEFVYRCSFEPKDSQAPGLFLHEMNRAVAALDGMVQRDLDLWKPLAHKLVQWPILAGVSPAIKKSQLRRLCELGLGRAAFIGLRLLSRTSTEDAATRYAISILMTLRENQDCWAQLTDPSAPQWAKDARNLPSFSKTTYKSWWELGKQAMLEAIPHPEGIPALAALAHAKERPAQKKALLLERIQRAMKSLAPRTPAAPGERG